MTGVFSGAPQTFGGLLLIRTTVKGTMTHFRPGLLGADHQLKIGAQFERGEHQLTHDHPDRVRFNDDAGQPFQVDLEPLRRRRAACSFTASGFLSDCDHDRAIC